MIGKYTREYTHTTDRLIGFNPGEHEATRRELWMQAAVSVLSQGNVLAETAVSRATKVLAEFDAKFAVAVKL